MTGLTFALCPAASYANAEHRLVLEFDDTDENRRFTRLVFEAALEGEPLVFRPDLEAELTTLRTRCAAAEHARDDAMQRVDAAEEREARIRAQLVDAEVALARARATMDEARNAGGLPFAQGRLHA